MDAMAFLHGFHFKNELWGLIAPVALMAADSITGFLKAWSTKSFMSCKMRSGLTKKAGEILLLVIVEIIVYAMLVPDYIMTGISVYIIIMELMSIFENLKAIGVPIPGFVSKILHTVDDTLKQEDVSETIKKIAELEKEIKALQGANRTMDTLK